MKNYCRLVSFALLPLALLAGNARADDQCAPNVLTLITKGTYRALDAQLKRSTVKALTTSLKATSDETSYQQLLGLATSIAAGAGADGRVVVTLPDGTVVLDTEKTNNSYANYQAKEINENHNSRVAILDSQLYPCGVGVETKLSSTTGASETYVARRLGPYLKSAGTVRISD